MKRTALRRKTPIKRSTKRIAPRSAKMRDLYEREGGRRDVVERILRERQWCQWWEPGEVSDVAIRVRQCAERSTTVHEILRRSAGGSIIDETNLMAVCEKHHDWIHFVDPAEARRRGFLKSRYAGRNA